MKILLVGGGSGGPVSPLLAVAEEIKKTHPKAKFILVGTQNGPERQMSEKAGVDFFGIPSGKLRRYFSWANFVSPFLVLAGFFKARKIIKNYKPDCIFGTGSFVQVPVIWAGWFLKVPSVIHQQDLVPSLANSLCQMVAKKITVSLEYSMANFASGWGLFYKKHREDKVIWTGNPCLASDQGINREKALMEFGLAPDFPTLFVVGGGTGSKFLNDLILEDLPELTKTVQIIHATGKNKLSLKAQTNYHPREFILNMEAAYAAADIVLCRAGMSTITELSNFKKVSIIVPMPNSHQEANALLLVQRQAALVIGQRNFTSSKLIQIVRKLLFDLKSQELLKENISKVMPKKSAEKISEIIEKLIVKNI